MAWSYTQKAADQLYADDEHGPVVFDPGATLGAPGSGNVISSGLPIAGQLGVWVDATHITGSSTLPIAAHAAHTGDVTSPAGSVVLTYANALPASKGGLPTGGTTGQVLAKSTNADYATGWVAGGGNVINVATPASGQLAMWTDATHIQGVAALPAANMPALAGDIISTAGTFATVYNNPVPTAKAGVPIGGTAGQVLAKNTGTNFDAGWINPPSSGGNVANSGSPQGGQLALWTDATHIQGLTTLPSTNFPALTGDVTVASGTLATTYANALPTAKGGVPLGGALNQVLAKNSAANYDVGWVNPATGGGTPGGADKQIQFNDATAFGGDADLTWNKTTNVLTLTGSLTSSGPITASGSVILANNIRLWGQTVAAANRNLAIINASDVAEYSAATIATKVYGTSIILDSPTVNTTGAFTGNGAVPTGGTTNQILQKNTNANYDVGWVTPSAAGGVTSVFSRVGAVVAATNDYTFAQIGSKPTTIAGYGITDAFTQATADTLYATLAHTHTFASLTSRPTTLLGYGITDAQPLDTELTAIAGLASTTDNFIVGVANVWSARTPAQVRTTLGLVIGTNVQAWDADLDAIAAVASQTAFGRGFLTQVDAAGARGYIGAGSGGGDLSSNTAVSVDNELALFNLTSGKSIKRATTSGIIKLTSGVVGAAVAGTDYQAPGAYLTANQTITLSTDVTGSGTTAITATIAAKAVTYAKMQDVSATSRVLGRITAGAGVTEELTAANLKTILGLAFTDISGTATDAQVPDIHTLTGIPNLTSNGFVKTGGGIGTLSVDTASYLTANQSITLSGDVGGTGTTAITTAIGANKVTLGMMATMATASILGRTTAATGNVEVLTSLPWAYTGDVTRAANSNALVYNNALPTGKGGLPVGGTANQVLAKIDGTNYNAQWVTPAVYEALLTFQFSLVRSANTINLVGDTASPGLSKYYGTDATQTRGFYNLPSLATLGGEPALGNPSTNGYILSSTTGGVRSWIAPPSGGGTPGGTSGQPQYNLSGAFAGVTNVVMVAPGVGTLGAAATAATAGTLLQLMPGDYTENNSPLVELAANVHLRGAGMYVSRILSNRSGTLAPNHGIIAPGNNSVISDLSIVPVTSPTGNEHINSFSNRAGSTRSWTNVLVQNCWVGGGADCIINNGGPQLGDMTFVNCVFDSQNDCVMWQSNSLGVFINCTFRHTTKVGNEGLSAVGLYAGAGVVKAYNCRYEFVGANDGFGEYIPLMSDAPFYIYDFVVDLSRATAPLPGGADLAPTTGTMFVSNIRRWDGKAITYYGSTDAPAIIDQQISSTVARLPVTPQIGQTATVTNGAASLAYSATVTGGGSSKYLVMWNGTAWIVVGGGVAPAGGGGITEVAPGPSTIQAALATAVAGDTVRLAAGIFDMTSLGDNGYILLPDNVNLIGHGPEVTIIKSQRQGFATPGCGILAPGSNCLIQDLAIVGVSATGTGNENCNPLSARSGGGFTKNYDNAIYRNCYLKGINDVIICVGASLGHTTFEDCVIEGQCDIIMWQCAKNLVLRNCDLIHTTPAAWPGIGQTMLLMGDDNGSIKLYNCKIIARGATATASFSAIENVGANSFIEAYDVVIDYQGSMPSGGYHDIQNYGSGAKTMLLSNVTRADGKPLVVDPDFTIPVNSAKNTLLSVTVALLPSNPGVGDTAWVTDGASGLLYNATIAAGGTTKYFVQWNGTNWKVLGGGAVGTAGGGVSDFLALTDTPDTYVASKFVAVNSGATALEFVNAPSGGGGTPGGATTQLQFNNAGAFGGATNAYIDAADGMLTVTGNGIAGFWSQFKVVPTAANADSAIFLRSTHGGNQDWFFGSGSGAGWNHFRIADLTAGVYDVLTVRTGAGHEVVLGGQLAWTATNAGGTPDTGIGRSSAGVVKLTDGGAGIGTIVGKGTVPAGGTTDQVLAKVDGTDYALKWATPSGGGAVSSVFTRTGAVVALEADYSAFYSLVAHTHTFASLTSKPTTVSGFGITDAAVISGTPANLQYARWTNATTISGVAASTVKTDLALVAGDVGLGSVTNNAQTQAAIVPNTAPTAGQVLIGNAGNTAYAKNTISGSGATITLGATGVVTISAIAKASITGAPTGAFVGDTDTQTLTNKRINARTISSATGNTTPTPDVSTADLYIATGMTVGMTFGSPTGTPVEGQKLVVRVNSASAQSLGWNAIYRASSDLSLPTTTTAGKTLYLGFMYNSVDTKWDLLAKLDNF